MTAILVDVPNSDGNSRTFQFFQVSGNSLIPIITYQIENYYTNGAWEYYSDENVLTFKIGQSGYNTNFVEYSNGKFHNFTLAGFTSYNCINRRDRTLILNDYTNFHFWKRSGIAMWEITETIPVPYNNNDFGDWVFLENYSDIFFRDTDSIMLARC